MATVRVPSSGSQYVEINYTLARSGSNYALTINGIYIKGCNYPCYPGPTANNNSTYGYVSIVDNNAQTSARYSLRCNHYVSNVGNNYNGAGATHICDSATSAVRSYAGSNVSTITTSFSGACKSDGSITVTFNVDIYAYNINYASYRMSGSASASLGTNTYTITYNANGHGTAPANQTKTYGVNLTLKPFISNQSTGGTTSNYTITGNANNNTWSGSNGSASYTTAKTTYNQTYWNTNSSGTGTNYGSQGSYTANAAATLYAIWGQSTTPASYTYNLPSGTPTKAATTTNPLVVSYNANGGTSTPSAQTSTKPVTYSFDGWYTAATGGTKRTSSSQVTASETVYAHMTSTTGSQGALTLANSITKDSTTALGYTVSYNANGGTSTPSTQRATNTTAYSFNGWHEGSASGTNHAAKSSFTPTADITLYAGWDSNTTLGSITVANAINKSNTTTTGYTVTFNANQGTTTNTSATATRTISYSFAGWAPGSASGTPKLSAGATYSPSANTILYATWNSSVISEGSILLPNIAECTRSGYELLGWSTSPTATIAAWGPGQYYTPTESIILYAVWREISSGSQGSSDGGIHIYNSPSTTLTYTFYIYNGTTNQWVKYTPYIYEANDWEVY